MTRVDLATRAVIVGDAERRALSAYLDEQQDLISGYLFGSQASGVAGPLSDVDVAVWLDPDLDGRARLRRQLDLMAGAAKALGEGEVQVVILNDAPPLLAHRVLRARTLLSDRNPRARIALETKAIERYLDTMWLREEMGRGLRRRMAEGTYGRARHR